MRAIQIEEFGGPEMMNLVELPDPVPGEGEIVVDVARCGVNFADTHATRNDYLAEQQLPLIPGGEISGPHPRRPPRRGDPGDRRLRLEGRHPRGVGDPGRRRGLRRRRRGAPPPGPDRACARSPLRAAPGGRDGLVEAAAGGTGTLAVQLAKRAGARVIGVASRAEKRELVERLGADATVDSGAEDLKAAILEANDGNQIDAVFQMSGGEAFEAMLRTLAPFGRMVTFGIASREQNEVSTGHLMRNSRAVIGFWLMHLIPHRDEVAAMIGDLFAAVAAGELEVVVGGVYPLSEARRAHEEIAARRTSGKLLLDPSA